MHDREMEDDTSGQKPSMTKLIPTHFVYVDDGGINKTYVQKLCLQPNLDAVCCPHCPAGGELSSKPLPCTGARCIVIVVTMKGRYEITKGEIICSLCPWRRPHDVDDDYGDLFPGTCNSAANQFLVAADALHRYASLLSQNPQSVLGFISTLDQQTQDGKRACKISEQYFRRALTEFNHMQSDLGTISDLKPNECPCCPEYDRTADIMDGNFKCWRWDRKKKENRAPYHKGACQFIIPDAKVKEVFRAIYEEGNVSDETDKNCGPNSFVALNSKKMRNLKDGNGIFVRACDHGVLNSACNIDHGEAYGYNVVVSYLCAPPNVQRKVVVHCSDIACKTCAWAVKVESTVGEILQGVDELNLTLPFKEVAPVLNAVHARAHV